MERRNLSSAKKEFTTQKIRQEWAEHEEQFAGGVDSIAEDWPTQNSSVSTTTTDIAGTSIPPLDGKPIDITKDETVTSAVSTTPQDNNETKSKKKRRKKSLMKKKATQRKSSSSSSVGSAQSDQNDVETDTISLSNNTATGSSNEDSPKSEIPAILQLEKDNSSIKMDEQVLDVSVITAFEQHAYRARDLDIHFFSDTELASAKSPSRPSTPIQSDSEFEMSHRADKTDKNDVMSSSASWKWGELPTQDEDSQEPITEDAKQAQRNSMLSNMFSFMKQTKKLRKNSTAEGVYLSDLDTDGMDPEVAALYFPPINKKDTSLNATVTAEDDRESGNGTSLPHSPSSMEGMKSLDSDYDDGKPVENK